MTIMTEDLQARFWMKVRVAPAAACWEWLAAVTDHGYGAFWLDATLVYAHRLAYELTFGSIPRGKELDHLCRNRWCVNPAHLEAVSSRENWWRGLSPTVINARKTQCIRGHPFDNENTYVRGDGTRTCRACDRERHQRRAARSDRHDQTTSRRQGHPRGTP